MSRDYKQSSNVYFKSFIGFVIVLMAAIVLIAADYQAPNNVCIAPDGMCTGTTTEVTISSMPTVTPSLSSSITTSQVTVTNVATLIKAANTSRLSLGIRNQGSVDVYIGSSGVTTSTGIVLKSNNTLFLDNNTAAVYGITVSSTTTVGWVEE